jgi:hypothetical protein
VIEGLDLCSTDHRFGLSLRRTQVRVLLRLARNARAKETGGILVGRYNDAFDRADVLTISPPPRDSRAGWCHFECGSDGLEAWLLKLWRAPTRTYYLGEWHFHPYASALASSNDQEQMRAIAADARFACPEPVLLILGGDPHGTWEARAYVFTRDGAAVSLGVREV